MKASDFKIKVVVELEKRNAVRGVGYYMNKYSITLHEAERIKRMIIDYQYLKFGITIQYGFTYNQKSERRSYR